MGKAKIPGGGGLTVKNGMEIPASLASGQERIKSGTFIYYYTTLYGGSSVSTSNASTGPCVIKVSDTLALYVAVDTSTSSRFIQFKALRVNDSAEKPFCDSGSSTFVSSFRYTAYIKGVSIDNDRKALVCISYSSTLRFYVATINDDLSVSLDNYSEISTSDSTSPVVITKLSSGKFLVTLYIYNGTYTVKNLLIKLNDTVVSEVSQATNNVVCRLHYVYSAKISDDYVLLFGGNTDGQVVIIPVYISGSDISYGTIIVANSNYFSSSSRFSVIQFPDGSMHLITGSRTKSAAVYQEIVLLDDTILVEEEVVMLEPAYCYSNRLDSIYDRGIVYIFYGVSSSNVVRLACASYVYDEESGYKIIGSPGQTLLDSNSGLSVSSADSSVALLEHGIVLILSRAITDTTIQLHTYQLGAIKDYSLDTSSLNSSIKNIGITLQDNTSKSARKKIKICV